MTKLFAVFAVALALCGCQAMASVDSSIQKSLPQLCDAALPVHIAFVGAANTGVVDLKWVEREAKAWAILEPLCRDPANANSATILIGAANAYLVITQAYREAT